MLQELGAKPKPEMTRKQAHYAPENKESITKSTNSIVGSDQGHNSDQICTYKNENILHIIFCDFCSV